MSFADRVIAFNDSLSFTEALPEGFAVINPFRNSSCAPQASREFYRKYYDDERARRIILGINPGRFGAGLTGVPFTDPQRLAEKCAINVPSCPNARELSSVYVYELIDQMGGVKDFYANWYINSICPLGFTRPGRNGRALNANYYDSPALRKAALPFIIKTLRLQLAFGIRRDVCFCLGRGKNAAFLEKLNSEYGFFERVVALDHPRFIAQYKWKERARYLTAQKALLLAAN